MSNWQFSQNGYVINGSPTEERDADVITLFDVDGAVIISVSKTFMGWHVTASDFYLSWVDFTDTFHPSYKEAIEHMFRITEHDHELSETGDIYEKNGATFANCELCNRPFNPYTED